MTALIATRDLLASAYASRSLGALALEAAPRYDDRRLSDRRGQRRASAVMPDAVARLRIYLAAHAGTGKAVSQGAATRFATGRAAAIPDAFLATATDWLPELYACDRGCLWLAGVHDDPEAGR